ncbi:flotillin family protein [Bifidobacterium stellenboschense]|uniref:Uncharacterized protein n=1 Tax=Bifidobacterium stellenboschense TaxID=762211 RepID=A0A087DE14_9BIFI|nr:flotillin family protein [Bifidobacterium stellenboschense]KFI93764.1 hypothetical protein BSTEL_2041 [Bifidobacterium stellenboschense]
MLEFLHFGPLWVIVPVVIVLIILACACYTVAPTDRVLVITGPGGRRFVTGKAAIIIPFLYRRDWLSLGVVQSELHTDTPIPTKDAILIDVSAVANFQIGVDRFVGHDGVERDPLEIAARNYLNQDKKRMMADVTQVLLGKMREAIGKTELRTLMENRDEFSETVATAARADMEALGLELVTFNVQDFADGQGVIRDMGADMAAQISRDAQLARIAADQQVAERQNQLDLKQAELKTTADNAKAKADMVYEITKAERTKELNIAQQDAEIAAEERRIELADRQAAVKEKELNATVRKQAEADRYAAEQRADAELYTTQKTAEADLYRQRQEAEAVKATADAQAQATRVKGEAEGAALKAKGEGEAAGIEAQGHAYNAMNNQLIIAQQYIQIMPQIARAIAEPLAKVDTITMYGDGNTTKLVGDTTNALSQISEGLAGSIGLDLKTLLNGALGGHMAGKAMADGLKKTGSSGELGKPGPAVSPTDAADAADVSAVAK